MTQSIKDQNLSRRHFLKYSALLSAAAASPLFLPGCAIDPVTGKKELMLVSREQEIAIDKQQSPFQFDSDYGVTQDKRINSYVSSVGKGLLPGIHRPNMPYSFQCVNATYINAYAFPGGTIAVTRGILLKLQNEAELAALLGHELGHVNARHSAEQVSKGTLSSVLVAGLNQIARAQGGEELGQVAAQLGMVGQSLLLSKYSRDNEREADALGNQYMVNAGYSSTGFTGLMEMLDSLHKKKPSSAQVMFSTHPMSSERLADARTRENGIYQPTKSKKMSRERYMDRLASLRAKKKGITLLQDGEKYMAKKEYDQAEKTYKTALRHLKEDYAAHVMMAKCQLMREKSATAVEYANQAKKLYPSQTQAFYLAGYGNMGMKRYSSAYQDFQQCDRKLPGNPQVTFFKGYCMDKKGQKRLAAENYMSYLKINHQPNKYSRYAYNRLREWGYAK